MQKGLGIAALVVAILSILVPVVTIYVVWLALVLAAVAAFMGDKAFPVAAALTCLVNLVFLSPMTWAVFTGEHFSGGSFFKVTTIILFIAPFVALILAAKKKSESTPAA